MYTLYILKCADGSLYTGIAKDLKKRLAAHRAGKGSKYVRARLPVKVVYTEKCNSRSKATKREMEIKNTSREKKLKLCMQKKKPPTTHA
jgi:putative endonuclease